MRRTVLAIVFLLAASLLITASLFGQEADSQPHRRVLSKVLPTYPDLARQMKTKGSVRLLVVVNPDGRVKSTQVLGGSPVFIKAAEEAVEKWRFETLTKETNEPVELRFNPE